MSHTKQKHIPDHNPKQIYEQHEERVEDSRGHQDTSSEQDEFLGHRKAQPAEEQEHKEEHIHHMGRVPIEKLKHVCCPCVALSLPIKSGRGPQTARACVGHRPPTLPQAVACHSTSTLQDANRQPSYRSYVVHASPRRPGGR